MIPQISEINFPEYATLHEATASFAEMGERTITTQVRIDGDIVPEFDGWELEFKGERFVLPTKDPQAQKNNTTRNSLVDLTFYSWPIYQMKRFFFFETTTSATGTVMADKYKASVNLNLVNFVALFNRVLNYYFDGKIVADLASGSYSPQTAFAQIDYSYIWDVLQNFYELYGVRWRIVYNEEDDVYEIKIGYDADVIDNHEFEYGFEGGLLHFERQVEDDNIKNILLGRGGEKNLPYRYFKRVDPNNPDWTADPDAIKELENIYFDRLRDANFRNYVQGWKTNPNRELYPGESVETYDSSRGARDWAYKKGHEDETFDPVEYVKDQDSIDEYGERWGALDDNDDIYPTIQGLDILGLGRVDEVVDVSTIITDDIHANMVTASEIVSIDSVLSQADSIPAGSYNQRTIRGGNFVVPTGKVANIRHNGWFAIYQSSNYPLLSIDESLSKIRIYDAETDEEILSADQGLSAGTYYYVLDVIIRNSGTSRLYGVTFGLNGLELVISDSSSESWKPTFDIWIKNIFESERLEGETDEEYSLRIWRPILGDRLGNEAKIVFSDGPMSISEDYEFTIAKYPEPDNTKVTSDGYRSEWKLTLFKSDAEYDVSGLYIPNNTTGGKPVAGNHFFFIGIDMPFMYVALNEEKLTEYKQFALNSMLGINPTWVIHIDKVRADMINSDNQRLFDQISVGCEMHVKDKRFTAGQVLTLFANTITYSWHEPTDDNPYLLPDIEIVVSDKIIVEKSSSETMRGDIENIKSTYAKLSDMSTIVPRLTSASFLKKNGEEDVSLSPTKFASIITSTDFQQGPLSGRGWGFYRDNSAQFKEDQNTEEEEQNQAPLRMMSAAAPVPNAAAEVEPTPDSVLELDKLIVRKEMQVNSLVVNQISTVGGKEILSAASMECVQVVENDDSYVCFFDQKQDSVKNLFAVGDIAMGQVFTADNFELRYYKMIVSDTAVDSITLSKTGKAGSGVPKKGDIIVQYGNTSNPARQYVIVRDVIGGGYERMISGLNSVNATGQEYFFAGYDPNLTGVNRGRFFIGSQNSHVEFRESQGRIYLKGNVVQSPSGVEFPVPCSRGAFTEGVSKAYYGDMFTYNGASWICKDETAIDETHAVTTAPSESSSKWQKYLESSSPYRLDLSNENMSVNADANGNIIEGGYRPSCTAKLFYGISEVTSALYSISVPTGVTGVTIDSVTGIITLASDLSFTGDATEITVVATVSGVTRGRAILNISKAKAGKTGDEAVSYEIRVNANQISVGKNGNPSPNSITASAWKIVGGNAPVSATDVTIKRCYIKRSDGTRTSLTTASTASITSTVISNYSHVVFGIYKDDVLWGGEEETIPILRDGSDGRPGGKGDAGPTLRGPIDLTEPLEESRWFFNGQGAGEAGKWIDLCVREEMISGQPKAVYYRCTTSYEGDSFVASNWGDGSGYEFIATQILFAERTMIKNGVIDWLLTKSGDSAGNYDRIEAHSNTLECYDSTNEMRLQITAEDIDLTSPSHDSVLVNDGFTSPSHTTSSGSASETNWEIGTIDTRDNHTDVAISNLGIDVEINMSDDDGFNLTVDGGIDLYSSAGEFIRTLVSDSVTVDTTTVRKTFLSFANQHFSLAQGLYKLKAYVTYQWQGWTPGKSFTLDFMSSAGMAYASEQTEQCTKIGRNGVSITNENGFISSFGTKNNEEQILFQGKRSDGRIVGLLVNKSGVYFNQGDGWELISSEGSGGGGGSTVVWNQITGATGNTHIADITINGTTIPVYAPSDGSGGSYLPLSGGTMTGDITMGTNKVKLGSYGSIYGSGNDVHIDARSGSGSVITNRYFYDASDERLKDIIKDIDFSVEDLCSIPKVLFTWKNDETKREQIGVIAQGLKDKFPQLVTKGEDGYYAVNYDALGVLALHGVDLLAKKNRELEERIRKIEEKLGL